MRVEREERNLPSIRCEFAQVNVKGCGLRAVPRVTAFRGFVLFNAKRAGDSNFGRVIDAQNILVGRHACHAPGGRSDTAALKLTKPVKAQQHTDAGAPIDPAILNMHLQNMREEMTLP